MTIVDLANAILKLAPMDADRRNAIEMKARDWYVTEIQTKDPKKLETGNFVMKFLRKWGEEWYVQYATAFSYFLIYPFFRDLLHGEDTGEDYKDDE